MQRYYRSSKQAFEDHLLPLRLVFSAREAARKSARHEAIEEVLCRIPEDDYRKLKDAVHTFRWFIPCPGEAGAVIALAPLTEEETEQDRDVMVVYLSPLFEDKASDHVVAVVAHELAHIVLGHYLIPEYEQEQEEAVFQLICRWGFESEAKKLRRWQRWKAAFQKGEE
ncbi:MAG: hypothetical protein FJZ90_02305 [Chloroflexi bacterium]|nr:hypothetical protein [Chloroflexota bacterium]